MNASCSEYKQPTHDFGRMKRIASLFKAQLLHHSSTSINNGAMTHRTIVEFSSHSNTTNEPFVFVLRFSMCKKLNWRLQFVVSVYVVKFFLFDSVIDSDLNSDVFLFTKQFSHFQTKEKNGKCLFFPFFALRQHKHLCQ